MNGTSMAAPNACGSIALLLSALKAQGLSYSPPLIRRAVMNSASVLPDLHPLSQGHGLLQVDAAYDYLTRFHKAPYSNVPLVVSVNGSRQGRGVYLREAHMTKVSRDFKVTVEPKFHEDSASEEKVGYEKRFALSVSPKEASSWVTSPEFFLLVNGGRGFNITVDGSRLPPGLHFAQVQGHDVDYPDAGPAFEVPITIVKPIELADEGKGTVSLGVHSFTAGDVQRHFVTPPVGSTYMEVVLTDRRPVLNNAVKSEDGEGKDGSLVMVALQTVQLLPHTPFRDAEFEKYVSLSAGQREAFCVRIEAGVTVEIVLAQYAIAEGAITVGLDVAFRGLLPQPTEVAMQVSPSGKLLLEQKRSGYHAPPHPAYSSQVWFVSCAGWLWVYQGERGVAGGRRGPWCQCQARQVHTCLPAFLIRCVYGTHCPVLRRQTPRHSTVVTACLCAGGSRRSRLAATRSSRWAHGTYCQTEDRCVDADYPQSLSATRTLCSIYYQTDASAYVNTMEPRRSTS